MIWSLSIPAAPLQVQVGTSFFDFYNAKILSIGIIEGNKKIYLLQSTFLHYKCNKFISSIGFEYKINRKSPTIHVSEVNNLKCKRPGCADQVTGSIVFVHDTGQLLPESTCT